jgi:hypothetical protein
MDAVLTSALRPVLRDLATLANGLAPQIIDEQWPGQLGQLTARLGDPASGRSMGISVMTSESPSERVASLADQVQEWVIETLWLTGLPATWPECPLHPNSHPLRATADGDQAMWTCPKLNVPIAPIGSLTSQLR